MCQLIESKLNEHEMNNKLVREKAVLNQLLNTFSDGYILLDSNNMISNINENALQLLNIKMEDAEHKYIGDVISELDVVDLEKKNKNSIYDEVMIKGNVRGMLINNIYDRDTRVGASINFKNLDKISNKLYGKVLNSQKVTFNDIIGKSESLQNVKNMGRIVAKTTASVLLLGESGTGKELFARAIHNSSNRRSNYFVAVNCSAIPGELLESELFGYEGGAFTGSKKAGKVGKFEIAHKGTIFLDEIGDMPYYLQAKILRAIQEKTIEKVGSLEQQEVDIRIIAATNKNLEQSVKEGTFREDLYYRLNVVPINIPELRERKGDIEMLVNHFFHHYINIFDRPDKSISSNVMKVFNEYDWPGNVRQLENVIQYLIASNDKTVIDLELLPEKFFKKDVSQEKSDRRSLASTELKLKSVDIEAILQAIAIYGNDTQGKIKAAKSLGISKATLYRRLREIK